LRTDDDTSRSLLRDPRLAAHALAPAPVWLWSPDADRILWANPAGAAIFDAASPGEAALLRFDARHSASVQVARLSGTLPHGGAPRLERLRGFGASIGATLVCLCSRVALADSSSAILIASAERARKAIALPARATRLLRDFGPAAAIFSADSEIIAAQPAAIERMGNQRDLVRSAPKKPAREASLNDSGRRDPPVIMMTGSAQARLVRSGFRTAGPRVPARGRMRLRMLRNYPAGRTAARSTASIPLCLADRRRDAIHADKSGIRRSSGLAIDRRARP
jgi:hypothetical protein